MGALLSLCVGRPEDRYAGMGADPVSTEHVLVTNERFEDKYTVGRKLGEGAFAVVHLATNKYTNASYAVKVINRNKLTLDDDEAVKLEVSVLAKLNHPNIIKYVDFYDQDQQYYYLVTELLEGGELFDRIVKNEYYTENNAREVAFLLLSAIKYIHDKDIVHRDLKPENLLLVSHSDDTSIKVADFGFADYVTGPQSLSLLCGTPGYLAPEIILRQHYGKGVDIWSAGIITFILLGGYPPFIDEDQNIMFEKTKRGQVVFDEEYWSPVSDLAKDLILKMLKVNPLERVTVDEALNHAWFMSNATELSSRDLSRTIEGIKRFNAKRRLKAAGKTVMAIGRMKRLTMNAEHK